MDAADARAVVERLQRDAYYPIRVAPQGGAAGLGLDVRTWRQRRVTTRDVVEFTQQFGALMDAGLPLERALVILEELTVHPRIRETVADVLRSVRGGASLSDALAKHHPRPFSRLYINMVRAGE